MKEKGLLWLKISDRMSIMAREAGWQIAVTGSWEIVSSTANQWRKKELEMWGKPMNSSSIKTLPLTDPTASPNNTTNWGPTFKHVILCRTSLIQSGIRSHRNWGVTGPSTPRRLGGVEHRTVDWKFS